MLKYVFIVLVAVWGFLIGIGSSYCHAEPVNYFDKNGKLFMQSNRVGNQIIYTDPVGNLVATQNSVATPVFVPPLAPKLTVTELPQLPQLQPLPTLEIFK